MIGVLALAHEVTDLVTGRQRAEQAEERFRLALDAAHLGTWDYDPSRQQPACDQRFRALCGLRSDEETTTSRLIEAVVPDDRSRVQEAVERSFSPGSGGSFTIECRTRTDEGVRWLSLKGRTFFDGGGRPVRFTGVAMDVTEQVVAHGLSGRQRSVRGCSRMPCPRSYGRRARPGRSNFTTSGGTSTRGCPLARWTPAAGQARSTPTISPLLPLDGLQTCRPGGPSRRSSACAAPTARFAGTWPGPCRSGVREARWCAG